MREFVLAAALALASAGATFAATNVVVGTELGVGRDAITQSLTDLGFEVRRFENEGKHTEIYAVRGSETLILIVDKATGKVVHIGESGD